MVGGPGLEGHREVLEAACAALVGLGASLWEAGSGELAAVMALVDRVVVLGEAARVAVAAEAIGRGEPGSGAVAVTPVQWVRAHAPSTRAGGAGQVVAVAQALGVAGNAAVKEAVTSGVLPVRSAAVVVAEADRLRPLLAEGAESAVLAGLVAMAVGHGPRGCRMLRPRLLAEYGCEGRLQGEQDRAKRFVVLSQPRVDPLGLAEYSLTLDVEGRAVLEAALGPLAAPHPVRGEPDLRPADRRRGEALVALVRRAVAASGTVPTGHKSTLFVTVDLDTLTSGLRGAGETVAGSEAGLLLAPETVRRLACDAAVIPVVLAGDSEVLDLGRAQRLFTAGQTRRLWLRDRHCTYPGCDVPAQWCDAHHLTHWADGGRTDLDNAALLCQRHHTTVHQRRHAAHIHHPGAAGGGGGGSGGGQGTRVEWDLRYGSYDDQLSPRGAPPTPRRGANGPPMRSTRRGSPAHVRGAAWPSLSLGRGPDPHPRDAAADGGRLGRVYPRW